jgi:hypothetical protein
MQQDIIEAKNYIEAFIREAGMLKTFNISELMIGYVPDSEEDEKPY